jgi:TM2 domain-containing membrane protein YozV
MLQLTAQDGTEYPITNRMTTIGRENCDINLLQDHQVSRQHAKIEQRGDEFVLTDLDSTNGTFVNGARLRAPHTLQTGDTVRIGHTRLAVQAGLGASPTHLIDAPQHQPEAPSMTPMGQPSDSPAAPPSQPLTKDKTLAYILEFLLLGLGWLYVGKTSAGIVILVSWVIVGLGIGLTVSAITGGFGCICTAPMSIVAYALSLTKLSAYMNERPHIFQ